MAYDLLIRNGLVIDGTGTPGRHAAWRSRAEDRSRSAVSTVTPGKLSIASDGVVSPGFHRSHTHYDAQSAGRRSAPSSWHGVDRVVMATAEWHCAVSAQTR